jgi:MinD-like ATPase involved in chromosome partitioning or flagellar assembly
MHLILAGPDRDTLIRTAYDTFNRAGFEVMAVVGTAEALRDSVAQTPGALVVADADIGLTPDEALTLLTSLKNVKLALVLPSDWETHRERFLALPNVVAGYPASKPWPNIAADLARRQLPQEAEARTDPGQREPAPARPSRLDEQPPPRSPRPAPAVRPAPRGGTRRTCALWSGPAGGTGRTMLALGLAILAAERERDAVLVALSEPAVSAYLHLPRVPNVTTFARSGKLPAAEQGVSWQREDGEPAVLRVLLGPARPRDGVLEREDLQTVLEAVRSSHELVILDLPPLVPGGNLWTLEPLRCASDVVLVMAPTVAGVAATVEALATLRDVQAPGRAHLALNRRSAGGLSTADFTAAVADLWGSCPQVAAEIPPLADLVDCLDRGELPDLVSDPSPLARPLAALGEAAVGLITPAGETAPAQAEHEGGPAAGPKREGRRIGLRRLISVEVVD